MAKPTPFERDLGRAIRASFGANTKVVRFGDDTEETDCFIVSGFDAPVAGVNSYGSVGLSRNPQRAGDVALKVEILAACAAQTPSIDNLVASCVFESVKNRRNISYGTCIPDIIAQYAISKTLRHVTFVAPFLWEGMDKISVEGETVYFLMMLPISDAERDFLDRNGIDALEQVFSDRQIDIFDIDRPSAVG